MRLSGLSRDEVFITTKFYPSHEDPAAEAERSLKVLGVDYVDLYLVHWPEVRPTWAWPGMERGHKLGYARSVGVSNFGVSELEQVMAVAKIPPVVNQIQLSPFTYRRGVLDKARSHELIVEAYSPLGTGRHLSDERVKDIASRVGRSPAQVLLRWCIQLEVGGPSEVDTSCADPENGRIFDFALSDTDMAELDALDETDGTDQALERNWW